MFFDCATLTPRWFDSEARCVADSNAQSKNDTESLLSEIDSIRDHFYFHLLDIGVAGPTVDFGLLVTLARATRDKAFYPRLVTTGEHFTDLRDTTAQIAILSEAGIARITLKLNSKTLDCIPPKHCIMNYVCGCAANGVESEILFNFDNVIPESFLQLLKDIESLRFYTKTYPVRVTPVTRAVFSPGVTRFEHNLRVVFLEDGEIAIRQRGGEVTETLVGNMRRSALSTILNPQRLELSSRSHNEYS